MSLKNDAKELANMLRSIASVTYEDVPNSQRFRIDASSGTKWARKIGPSKWGNIHYKTNHILIALDFPNGTLSPNEVVDFTGLTQLPEKVSQSGFFIKDHNQPYGYLRIKLYDQDACNQEIINRILDLAKHMFNLACR